MEPPAVVGLLTNDYTVPPTAVTATMLDIASRAWIQLAHASGEVVVFTRGSGQQGDVLRPFEQQVLNHLAGQTFDGVTSAATLATAQHRLTRRWWRRFRRGVVAVAREYGLTRVGMDLSNWSRRQWPQCSGSCSWWSPGGRGRHDQHGRFAGSASAWIVGLAVVISLAVETVRVYRSVAELPTDDGLRRAAKWLGYRARLLARIPEHASVVAPPEQQRALADACVMGVAEHVIEQLSVAAEDERLAWSDAGGTPHMVRVRYPTRPAYGRQPIVVTVIGVITLMAVLVGREMLDRIADGELLESLYECFPEHDDLVENIAEILATLMFIPIAWSIWAIVAGVVDTVSVTERVGLIVRARRPIDVTAVVVGCGRSPTATAIRCSSPSTTGRVESSPRGWRTSARPHPRSTGSGPCHTASGVRPHQRADRYGHTSGSTTDAMTEARQTIVALDLEGVLVPEIWIVVAESTGISALRRTTRDEPDYDLLMRGRLDLLGGAPPDPDADHRRDRRTVAPRRRRRLPRRVCARSPRS